MFYASGIKNEYFKMQVWWNADHIRYLKCILFVWLAKHTDEVSFS